MNDLRGRPDRVARAYQLATRQLQAAPRPFDWEEAGWGALELGVNARAVGAALARGDVKRLAGAFGRWARTMTRLGEQYGWAAAELGEASRALAQALESRPLLPMARTPGYLDHALKLLEDETQPEHRNPRVYLAQVAAVVTAVRTGLQGALGQGPWDAVPAPLARLEERIIGVRDGYPR